MFGFERRAALVQMRGELRLEAARIETPIVRTFLPVALVEPGQEQLALIAGPFGAGRARPCSGEQFGIRFLPRRAVESAENLLLDPPAELPDAHRLDRKSTRLNSSHGYISYAV